MISPGIFRIGLGRIARRGFYTALVAGVLNLSVGSLHASEEGMPPRVGDRIFEENFEAPGDRGPWSEHSDARLIQVPDRGTCLEITVPDARRAEGGMVRTEIDLTPFRGSELQFEALVKAKDVSKPPQPYNGVKFMFHYESPVEGPFWRNQGHHDGSFDWKRIAFAAPVAPDATTGWIYLGLQESSGTAWFDDITVTVSAIRPARPAPDPDAGSAFRGHDLERLRGVMSPADFKEEDFRVLGQEWNGNLIRWQMLTRWGAPYQDPMDYDLDLYDQWLQAELEELDHVVEACRKYGIYLVVDLHSPPGGRGTNGDLVMLFERPYLEKFISVWQQIAERYKGEAIIWGFDLVNEPMQSKPTPEGMPDYLEAQVMAAKAIREIDPERTIIFEANYSSSAEGFVFLEPVDMPRVVYQVHMYHPFLFTHQGVNLPHTPVEYPGEIDGVIYDKEALWRHLAPVREFQLAHNAHIYAGEFSAIRWAPGDSALRYIRDCIEIFEEYGWDWSYHSFREWHGWSVDHGGNKENLEPTSEPTDRKRLLLDWFSRNEKPRWHAEQ